MLLICIEREARSDWCLHVWRWGVLPKKLCAARKVLTYFGGFWQVTVFITNLAEAEGSAMAGETH